ncbi:DUF1573 domain-containing protein [Sphingobacterium corticibacterium]|uniref:DUF1573 domain-containing protein n=1 Tax=Sphingobacterium corticibacterium TaxID=2484746 RepID=A0A4Q6Y0T1_9SPHI|nr:DUF1573 domain-containing protein [Sphingobacterium corticibacterium]RZF62817.1 DUF1573 domain-containing protein [Sphingobacterium corticibacterium]
MNILKSFFVCMALATLVSCGNSGSNEEQATDTIGNELTQGGKIEFGESVYDFGEVKEGEVVEHVYAYTNTGTEPVILSQVSASCGCTTPSYTQTPVLPGKSGEVKVSFDSNGQVGKQQKIVTIVSNAENRVMTVQLKGEVLPK